MRGEPTVPSGARQFPMAAFFPAPVGFFQWVVWGGDVPGATANVWFWIHPTGRRKGMRSHATRETVATMMEDPRWPTSVKAQEIKGLGWQCTLARSLPKPFG